MLKSISPTEVDFWMDFDRYSNLISSNDGTSVFTIDMIRLASIRKSISNFVRILTQKNIPVYFNDSGENVNFDGKYIYLSANINNKHDFDVAVGQSLHEGAHTLKTNFELVKCMFLNIPRPLLQLSDSKNITRKSFEKFLQHIWNIIEDRFIDNYVFEEAPGYRGYYVALYNKFWNCDEVDKILIDKYLFRYPSLASYAFRITNFTNLNTDLDALPRLDEIAKLIDITNIGRLTLTRDRIKIAFEVVDIVLNCVTNEQSVNISDGESVKCQGSSSMASPEDYFDFGDITSIGDSSEPVDISKKLLGEIGNVMTGENKTPNKSNEFEDLVHKISNSEIDNKLQSKLDEIIESQKNFLKGEFKKNNISEQESEMLDIIEKHGIEIVKVDVPNILPGNDSSLKVDCIVVQKMTEQLIFSANNIFPLSLFSKFGSNAPEPNAKNADSIKKGILLGIKLGKKLQIRSENNSIKTIRKKYGKINNRQLYEASFDCENIFYKTTIEHYHKANLHISIDASSSMAGDKWYRTMTSVTAICKAASMIDNVHITVSIRTTHSISGINIPYVILAYDSRVDRFSKVKRLFPYLSPMGFTPEGLAFGAIMRLFNNITPDEEDRYFLNFSDGEPCYQLKIPSSGLDILYMDDVAVNHTKSQVDKIRNCGVTILSYFIEELSNKKYTNKSTNQLHFQKMYGKDAKIVDVEDIIDLAKTINELFLKKSNKNS